MLRLEMLPAAHGDALWIEYGRDDSVYRMLIDGGPGYTYEDLRWRIAGLPPGERHFELLVVTHIDGDHIEGAIRLLLDKELGCTFDDIWFNDWSQIERLPGRPDLKKKLGAMQGEFLGALLATEYGRSWNSAWQGKAVVVPEQGDLVSKTLDSGMKLTLLSPSVDKLDKLRRKWKTVLEKVDFTPGDREGALQQLRKRKRLGPPKGKLGPKGDEKDKDNKEANGSSIAILAEYDGRSVLLAGDAHADLLKTSLERWSGKTGEKVAKIDAFKLPHHGSDGNLDDDLIRLLDCRDYLVSTNGNIFGHPDKAAINRILRVHKEAGRPRPRLHFNYRSEETNRWASPSRQTKEDFEAYFPEGTSISFYGKR